MATLKVHLFKTSYRSFTELLTKENIPFDRRLQLSEGPMAAGMTIEVISAIADASPWGALAIMVVAWLKAKKGRKLMLMLEDNRLIHAEGYSAKEVERFIEKAKSMTVIDASSDEEDK